MKNLKKKKLKATTTVGTGNAIITQAKMQAGIKSGKSHLKKSSKQHRPSGISDIAKQQYRRQKMEASGASFTENLDEKSLEYFNEVCARPYSEQAQFFLNAFWDEFGDQAEVIYAVHWDIVKAVEMESQGIHYRHLYEEGFDLDFDMALLLFERLNNFFDSSEGKKYAEYPKAVPTHMTSITRKKELRSKVDVNFDGRVGFLEYLLYQYEASPKTLMERSTRSSESNPELDAARAALAEVNKRIKAYEAEKARLTKISESGKGVKALGAKNMLAQIESGPLMEQLRAALITAEAKVRIVAKKHGTIWWMKREILEKKRIYGRSKKR